jgi:hypothetical protein
MMDAQVVWLGADTRDYAATCELCRDDRRWTDLFEATVVEGSLRLEADVGFATCRRGHRIRVRRIARVRAAAV